MKITNELKAGIVVVAAVCIGIFFFAKTATFTKPTYKLKTYFMYAGDLKPNAVVKLTGIEVGRVRDIKFVYDKETKVECLLELDTVAKVRKDSVCYISTTGLVGDACIGITAGLSEEFAKPDDVIASEEPVEARLLWKKADAIATNLDKILAEAKSIVVDNRENFNKMIVNIEETTENFKEFSADLKAHPWKLMFKGE